MWPSEAARCFRSTMVSATRSFQPNGDIIIERSFSHLVAALRQNGASKTQMTEVLREIECVTGKVVEGDGSDALLRDMDAQLSQDDVVMAEAWRRAAHCGLVALASVWQKVRLRPTETLAKIAEVGVGENALLMCEASRQGTFRCGTLNLTEHKTQSIKDALRRSGRTLPSRNAGCDCSRSRCDCSPHRYRYLVCGTPPRKRIEEVYFSDVFNVRMYCLLTTYLDRNVLVLSGVSGSGKTVTALMSLLQYASSLVIHIQQDIVDALTERVNTAPPCSAVVAEIVLDHLQNALRVLVASHRITEELEDFVTVGLVVELGSHHWLRDYLTMLLESSFTKRLLMSLKVTKGSLRIIACSTDIVKTNVNDNYFVDMNDAELQHDFRKACLRELLGASSSCWEKCVATAVGQKHNGEFAAAWRVMGNRRAASFFCKALKSFADRFEAVLPQRSSLGELTPEEVHHARYLVGRALDTAMSEYLLASPLSRLGSSTANVSSAFMHALGLAMTGVEAEGAGTLSGGRLAALGLVTGNTRMKGKFRYTMTDAMAEMGLRVFGCGSRLKYGRGGYPGMLAEYLHLLLQGYATARMTPESVADAKGDTAMDWIRSAVLDVVLATQQGCWKADCPRAHILTSSVSLESEEAVLDYVERAVGGVIGQSLCVLVNTPESPAAGVFVIGGHSSKPKSEWRMLHFHVWKPIKEVQLITALEVALDFANVGDLSLLSTIGHVAANVMCGVGMEKYLTVDPKCASPPRVRLTAKEHMSHVQKLLEGCNYERYFHATPDGFLGDVYRANLFQDLMATHRSTHRNVPPLMISEQTATRHFLVIFSDEGSLSSDMQELTRRRAVVIPTNAAERMLWPARLESHCPSE